MRRTVTITTIPDRKFRKALGVGRDDVLLMQDDDSVVVQRSDNAKRTVLGRKTLARRLGVSLAGASLSWQHGANADANAAFRFVKVSDDRTGYDG